MIGPQAAGDACVRTALLCMCSTHPDHLAVWGCGGFTRLLPGYCCDSQTCALYGVSRNTTATSV